MTLTLSDLLDFAIDDDDPDASVVTARRVLAGCALHATLTPPIKRLLRSDATLAVVVTVPSSAWVLPAKTVLFGLSDWSHVFMPGGGSKGDRNDASNSTTADVLALGRRVLGVSHNPERNLPTALLAAADIRLTIKPPSNRVISRVIQLVTGYRPRSMPRDVASGLDYDDICAAIRVGSSAAACVRRLVAAARSMSIGDPSLADVPLISDLHGYGAAQVWAENLIRDLDAVGRGELDYSRCEKAVVLASNPGLGKTTFVRSLAKSLGMPLFVTSIGSLFSNSAGHLDSVIKAFDSVIASAVAVAPSIIFLDELDGLPSRSRMSGREASWWNPLILHVLTTLDGAVSGAIGKVIVIGATNHPENLDAALVRPGRLSRVIRIVPPDAAALAGILRQHLGKDLPDADLAGVARFGVGGSGADAAGWVKGARLLARTAKRPMIMADLLAQVAPADTRSPAELLECAGHEAAHAVLCELTGAASVSSVSIISAGSAGGSTTTSSPRPQTMTRHDLERQAIVALAGRCYDELCGQATTGAGGSLGSDLAVATNLVASIHVSYGLGGTLLHLAEPDEAVKALPWDAGLKRRVAADLARIHRVTMGLVISNRNLIEAVAHRLIETRLLDGAEIRRMMKAAPPRPADAKRKIAPGGRHVH